MPAIISEHFREYWYIGKKTRTWFTCAPVLPCCLCTKTMEWSRNGAWLTLRRLLIFTKYKLWRKKIWVRGKTGGTVWFPETRHFVFFWPQYIYMINYSLFSAVYKYCHSYICVQTIQSLVDILCLSRRWGPSVCWWLYICCMRFMNTAIFVWVKQFNFFSLET